MSEKWISARDALELLRPECNSFSPSTAEAIRRYAAVGKVRAKAASFTVKGMTGLVVRTVVPIVTVIETPFAPFIALVVVRLNWNCCNVLL